VNCLKNSSLVHQLFNKKKLWFIVTVYLSASPASQFAHFFFARLFSHLFILGHVTKTCYVTSITSWREALPQHWYVLWNRIRPSRGAQRAEKFSGIFSASVPVCNRNRIVGQETMNREIYFYADAGLGVEGENRSHMFNNRCLYLCRNQMKLYRLTF
jgi:hypothetical protein